METRTAEIIMITKGYHKIGNEKEPRKAIAKYLAHRCNCPIDIAARQVDKVVITAMYDYIDSIKSTPPSSFVRQVNENYEMYKNLLDVGEYDYIDAILATFIGIQVADNDGYLDGFTEENTQKVTLKTNKEV